MLALLLLLLPQAPASQTTSSPVATMRSYVARCERENGDSAETAAALARLAALLWKQNELAEAETVAVRSQRIFERLLGPDNLRAADAINIRGAIAFARGDHRAALAAWLDVLRIRERERGGADADVAGVLNNLAAAQSMLGDLEAAQASITRALQTVERTLGASHKTALSARVTLASLLHRQGRLEEGRRVCEETLRILADAAGVEPLTEPRVRFNLAAILRTARDPAGARREAELAYRAFLGPLGPTHPSTVDARLLLIDCRIATGEQAEGDELIRKALLDLEAAGRADGPDAALLHMLLAEQASADGDLAAAESHARDSLRIREACFGPDHELLRHPLHLLGDCQFRRGNYGQCEVLWRRMAKIADRMPTVLPQNHAAARLELATCLAAQGRMAEAATCLEPALAMLDDRIDLELPALADNARLASATVAQNALDLLLETTRNAPDAFADRAIYGHVLRHKGLIARGLLARHGWLARNAGPEQKAVLDSLGDVVARLSASSLALSPRTESEMSALLAERTRLERRLSDLTTMAPVSSAATVELVAKALADGEVLVDFVVHEERPWQRSAARVCAFVVTRDARVRRVDLGMWNDLEPWVAAHRELCARRAGASAGNALAESTARSLRARLWERLGDDVGRARHVVVCPDAGLALLPFATLPGARPGTFLVEDVDLRVVLSAHDLLRKAVPARKEKLVAFGGIDYGKVAPPADERASLGLPEFGYLPGSAQEVETLAARFRKSQDAAAARVVVGAEASESALEALVPGATLVHLATHGFFLAGAQPAGPTTAVTVLLDKARSGIVLAGANGRGLQAAEDGILSADEAAWLDLTSCRLVAISACESGLGRTQSGEHLLGLRRALHLAGAQRTLTALWRVDDQRTRRWMDLLYGALLDEGMAPNAAWLAAQRRWIAQSRANGGDGAPGVFGAFILEGMR